MWNSDGLSMRPCGTPAFVVVVVDVCLQSLTDGVQFAKKHKTQVDKRVLIPSPCRLVTTLFGRTVINEDPSNRGIFLIKVF